MFLLSLLTKYDLLQDKTFIYCCQDIKRQKPDINQYNVKMHDKYQQCCLLVLEKFALIAT